MKESRAYKDDMIVQNAFVLILIPVQFCYLPEPIKHGLNDPIVRGVDIASDLETIRTTQLALDARDIEREILDKVGDASPLLCVKLRLLHGFDLLVLRSNI